MTKKQKKKELEQKITKVEKRDGTIVPFDPERIHDVIFKALTATNEGDGKRAQKLTQKVIEILNRRFKKDEIPNVEQIQDIIEEILILEGLVETAKAFILYREQRRRIREAVIASEEAVDRIDLYLGKLDWEVQENANMAFSLQGLNHYATSYVIKKYWLNKIYPKEIREANESGDFHLHNLDTLAPYCMGWDLYDLLLKGFKGVPGKVESRPPKHFRTALGQLVNFLYTLQGECYSEDTQVLTENGWKYFYQVNSGERVFTLNLETNEIELQRPYRFYGYYYKGELYHFKNKKIDLLVTPGHRMLVDQYCPYCKEKYHRKFVEAKDFKCSEHFIPKGGIWKKAEKDTLLNLVLKVKEPILVRGGEEFFVLPEIEIQQYRSFSRNYEIIKIAKKEIFLDDWLKFFGFWLADGCTSLRERKRKGRKNPYYEYEVRISQNKGKTAREFEEVLKKLPFNYLKKDFGKRVEFLISNKQLFTYLQQFAKAEQKFIPKEIKNLPKEKLEILFEWLIKGDGYRGNGNLDYYSKSRKLADDVQEIALKLGLNANIYQKKKGKFKWYRVGISQTKHFKLRKDSIKRVKYEGKVYCLEVPNHTLYVRRNGKALWCGNCAGAVAVSNFDTLLAPFIRYDNLNYQQVKQALQEFLYNMAVPTRVGFQTPFSNITLDLAPSPVFSKLPVIIGGKSQKETYGEFEEEMKIFDKALYEVYMEGDAKGRPFHFPIPTINITKDFPWQEPAFEGIFEASAKYGINYFANYINSEMKPDDVRSMCCRLRLNLTELYNRGGGGLFGSGSKTGCYDEKTEILTENGWKFFKDLTEEYRVFTLSEDNKIELHRPSKIFKYSYKGKMVQFKAKSLDLLVTPNHRMVVDHKGSQKRMFVEARDFKPYQHYIPKGGIWEGKEKEYFILPPILIMQGAGPEARFSEKEVQEIRELKAQGKTIYQLAEKFQSNPVTIYHICTKENYGNRERVRIRYEAPPLKIKMEEWLKFFGFWLAEGCTDNENIALDHGYRVIITQTNKKERGEIKKVLDKLPFHYYEEENNLIICNKQLWSYLSQFGNKYQKFIPKEIKKLSRRQLKILFDWMIKGDGHERKSTGQINYWTSSKRLADDLQEIVLKLGWMATLKPRKGKIAQIKGRKVKSHVVYEIGVQKTKHYVVKPKHIKEVDYKGKVYCCEVPNHTIFVRRNGKVTWCGNSIGVVTINLPRIGFLSKTKKEFFERLAKMMDLAKRSLEIKRKAIENLIEKGLYPYSRFYLQGIKKMRGKYYANHFSTIGLVGMNEALLNFLGENIASRRGRKFALEVLDFMREKLVKYQKETGNIYNLEATPAESTAYRLAQKDKEKYPDIITAGTKKVPYYTNSSQLPVNFTDDAFKALKLQDELQCKYTGGCIEKGNKVLTDKGLLPIEYIFENFEKLKPLKVVSFNKEKNIAEWDEIVKAVKIDVAKHNKIRIVGERNLDIVTSDWHPFFVLEKFKPNPACPICKEKVKNLKVFAVHLRWNPECREKYKIFPKYQVVEKRADELKVGDYILQNSYNLYPEKETELNNDLMWLLGFFIGDGCISKFIDNRGGNNLVKYKVRFNSEHREALEKTREILSKYFGVKAKVIKNDKRSKPLKEFVTSKKEVLEFFFKYGFKPGKKVYTIFVPKKIKENITKTNVFALLSGLIDSDGHISKRDGDFEYYTVSARLAEDLLEICSKAGIMVSKSLKRTKRKNEVDIWRLRIPAYEVTRIKKRLTNSFNSQWIREILSNRKKRQFPVVRVKKVSKVNVKDNQFYDLMTKKNHNYLAGKNCLVFIHNTVLHLFLGERVSDPETVKILVKKVFENFKLPYITLTPTFSICPVHGYLEGEHFFCPKCTIKQPCEVYSRVVGYLRPVQQWNFGKQQEFKERKEFKLPKTILAK